MVFTELASQIQKFQMLKHISTTSSSNKKEATRDLWQVPLGELRCRDSSLTPSALGCLSVYFLGTQFVIRVHGILPPLSHDEDTVQKEIKKN